MAAYEATRTRGAALPCAWVLRERGMLAWLRCEMPSRAAAAAAVRAGATASLLASLVMP